MIRLLRGLSREQVARNIGVSSQQLYKYENGINALSPQRLEDISKTLNRKISDLFI